MHAPARWLASCAQQATVRVSTPNVNKWQDKYMAVPNRRQAAVDLYPKFQQQQDRSSVSDSWLYKYYFDKYYAWSPKECQTLLVK